MRGNRFAGILIRFAALFAFCASAAIIALCVGSGDVPLSRIPAILLGHGTAVERAILMDIRFPRIILGLAVGGALSLAGVILQGMFRNPLVEPYTLGISGGAALGVCLNIVFHLAGRCGALSLPVSGFIGAGAAVLSVYFLSTRKYVMNVRDLLLTGVMISFICSSLVMLVMAVSKTEDLHGIIFWTMGSLEEPDTALVTLALAVSLLALAVSYVFSLDLNALGLGEEDARHLGVSVENAKRILFLIVSIATGLSVSVSGVIGFVGLAVPHFMRLFFGNDHRMLLAASWMCGGAFLVFCDTLARTVISPLELPVGVITGILGGGIFVYALGRNTTGAGK